MIFHENEVCTSTAQRILQLIGMLLCSALHNVQATEDFSSGKWTYNFGIDSWRLDPSVKTDSYPGYAEENTNLLLANAATKWRYRNTSAYVAMTGTKNILNSTKVSIKARGNQTNGLRLDEAMVEHHISPSLGVRAGVVNYKTSWCRTYEPDNGWIREAELMCTTNGVTDVTGGAPGAQIFTNTTWGSYRMQNQVGIYRPLAFNYAPKEFGNFRVTSNDQVVRNHKVGFNINIINLENAIEGRLSYIRANQKVDVPAHQGFPAIDVPQTSNLLYFGLSGPVTQQLSVKFTHFAQTQSIQLRPLAYIANFGLQDIAGKKSATTLELAYRMSSVDLVSAGLGQVTFDNDQTVYSPEGLITYQRPPFYIQTRQFNAAWRHDWPNGMFGVAQLVWSVQKDGSEGFDFASHGNALGVRLGYQF